jgi:hypothetical protein
MGTEDAPVCRQHAGEVRMSLSTLHSDASAPEQVLAAYTCPECGSERRLPMSTQDPAPGPGDGVASWGAA